MRGLPVAVAFLAVEHRLQGLRASVIVVDSVVAAPGLSSCGAWAFSISLLRDPNTVELGDYLGDENSSISMVQFFFLSFC